MSDPRSRIPGVDRLLESEVFRPLFERWPRQRVADALRSDLERLRSDPSRFAATELEDPKRYAQRVEASLARADLPSLRRVINATGVVLHTNLGRAPLAGAARDAMVRAASGYSNLEYDLAAGGRGSRYVHCADLVCELVGAEAALVTNNNAAALVLAMNALARDGRVLVSRGELVEIGGGFRIPEMLDRAGAVLVEVGSTNRTRPDDYTREMEDAGASAILKVHRSNFRVSGFTEAAPLDALAAIASDFGAPLVHDLGSGLLADHRALGLPYEPTPAESIASGAGLVCFSGDKLLGGPQAGVIAGRADLVARLRDSPLCRAFRVDKGTLAALEATLRLYRDPVRALEEIPVLAALSASTATVESRASALVDALGSVAAGVEVVPTEGFVGGGTYPGVELESWAVKLHPSDGSATRLAERLRGGDPPVIGRTAGDAVLLDARTLQSDEVGVAAEVVRAALAPTP